MRTVIYFALGGAAMFFFLKLKVVVLRAYCERKKRKTIDNMWVETAAEEEGAVIGFSLLSQHGKAIKLLHPDCLYNHQSGLVPTHRGSAVFMQFFTAELETLGFFYVKAETAKFLKNNFQQIHP